MITSIPIELQEQIYHLLHVNDRAKLLMALPKDTVQKVKSKNAKYIEKKLGIITRALKTKKLDKLTPTLHDFFCRCNQNDITFNDIIQDYPELKLKTTNTTKTTKTLAEKIIDGTVVIEDFTHIDENSYPSNWDLKSAIYKCSPRVFDIALAHEPTRKYFDDNKKSLFFNILVNCSNEPLINHVIANWSQDFASYIQTEVFDDLYRLTEGNTNQLALVLKHTNFSRGQLDSLWLMYLGKANVDCVCLIENYIKENQL